MSDYYPVEPGPAEASSSGGESHVEAVDSTVEAEATPQSQTAKPVEDTAQPQGIPEEIQELRESQKTQRSLYGAELAKAIPDDTFASVNGGAEVAAEVRAMSQDLGLSATEVKDLASSWKAKDWTAMKEPERVLARERTVDELNRVYGKNATEALGLARKLVARDPRVHRILASGMGDDPKTVLAVVKSAWNQRHTLKAKK